MDNGVQRSSRPVAIWLLAGVAMIMIQVLLGGITRLTGSGLSITEWKPLLGTLPPLNEQQWSEAFEKYKQIAQYKVLNYSFTLHDFKFIFFWEWLHRLWARLIAVAFAIPFIVFIIQKRFKKEMIRPMIVLFLLGALQGLVGWIMVMSGLNEENIYVSHYRLAIHFILALGLLCFVFWFAIGLLLAPEHKITDLPLKKFTGWLIVILILQLIYGAFMAGLKAAVYAPTWPDINGKFLPNSTIAAPVFQKFFDHPLMVQFIHRTLAYLLLILVIGWWIRSRKIRSTILSKTNWLPLVIVFLQVVLGILTVLNAPYRNSLLWFGVAHQFVAMLLLLSLVFHYYLLAATKS